MGWEAEASTRCVFSREEDTWTIMRSPTTAPIPNPPQVTCSQLVRSAPWAVFHTETRFLHLTHLILLATALLPTMISDLGQLGSVHDGPSERIKDTSTNSSYRTSTTRTLKSGLELVEARTFSLLYDIINLKVLGWRAINFVGRTLCSLLLYSILG